MLRKILVIINQTENDWRVMEGISAFNHAMGWRIRLFNQAEGLMDTFNSWNPDGIIYNLDHPFPGPANIPCVSLFTPWQDHHAVTIDHKKVGKTAANYFLEKGFSNFVFVTGQMRTISRGRYEGFRTAIEEKQKKCCYYETRSEDGLLPSKESDVAIAKLGEWLAKQPHPLAVYTMNDYYGHLVLDACIHSGLNVPEQVAILGTDNDPHVCSLSNVTLSSVRINYHKIGATAAKMLADQFKSQPRNKQPKRVLFEPDGIEERVSSDILAIDDVTVAKALHYIHDHCTTALQASEVANAAGVSKTILQQKFKKYLGRSPLQEIHRQRIDHAAEVLRMTDLSLSEVAEQCGFSDQAHFSKLFRKIAGTSPGAFRTAK